MVKGAACKPVMWWFESTLHLKKSYKVFVKELFLPNIFRIFVYIKKEFFDMGVNWNRLAG